MRHSVGEEPPLAGELRPAAGDRHVTTRDFPLCGTLTGCTQRRHREPFALPQPEKWFT